MNKLLVIFALVGSGMIMLLALLIALASASASLANGVANAAASTALLSSQCTGALLVVIALFAGSILGAGIARWQIRAPQLPTPKWLPGPNAHRQRGSTLLHPSQPIEYPQPLLVADAEEDEELPLQKWGF